MKRFSTVFQKWRTILSGISNCCLGKCNALGKDHPHSEILKEQDRNITLWNTLFRKIKWRERGYHLYLLKKYFSPVCHMPGVSWASSGKWIIFWDTHIVSRVHFPFPSGAERVSWGTRAPESDPPTLQLHPHQLHVFNKSLHLLGL